MKKIFFPLFFLSTFLSFACTQTKKTGNLYGIHDPKNRLPKEIERILSSAKTGILYSLGSEKKAKRLYRYRVAKEKQLSADEMRLVGRDILLSIASWRSVYTMCFVPTHILRIQKGNTLHDFIIGHDCTRLYYLRDGRSILSVGLGRTDRLLRFVMRDTR